MIEVSYFSTTTAEPNHKPCCDITKQILNHRKKLAYPPRVTRAPVKWGSTASVTNTNVDDIATKKNKWPFLRWNESTYIYIHCKWSL